MPAHTRRSFVLNAFAGAAVGASWSSALVYSQRAHSPRIDVIGDADTQLALLDTGDHRLLFALGPSAPWLDDELSAMIGPFRRRIDLVIAGGLGIASIRQSEGLGLSAGEWLAMPSADEVSPFSQHVISESTRISLSHSVAVTIEPFTSAADWVAICERGTTAVALSPRLEAVATCPTRPLAAIAPTGNLGLALRQRVAETLVCNAALLEGPARVMPWLRTFAGTAARLELGVRGIGVPSWLERPSE